MWTLGEKYSSVSNQMSADPKKNIVEITRGDSPLILGMPHTGTYVPANIFDRLNETGKRLADTDWHVHRLYDGLVENVTSVRALFHRYVIDANRDPSGTSLYPGQNTTELCPTTDFNNSEIYEKGQAPTPVEIENRRQTYHQPYHQTLTSEISRIKSRHGFAILYDCHSIRSHIPHLFDGKLPDFSIGTFDSKSCNELVENAVEKKCANAEAYTSVLNGRFKGGWTTRHYGDPKHGIHAVQMELSQSTYMEEESPFTYLPKRADDIRSHLQAILITLLKLDLNK